LRGVVPMARNSVLTRGGAVVARRAHNPKVVGSNPTPATKSKEHKGRALMPCLFCCHLFFRYRQRTR
jgi:hypothetical protein